jgi:hypothetical protein
VCNNCVHHTSLYHTTLLCVAQFEETADRDVASTHHALQAKSLHRQHGQHQQRTAPLSSQSYHPPRSSSYKAVAARGTDRTKMLGSHSHHPPVSSRFRGSSRPLSSHSEHSGGDAPQPQPQQQQHVSSDTVHYSGSSSGAAARGSATQQQQAPELAGEHSERQQHQQHSSSGNNNSSSSSSGATLAEAAVLRRLRAAAVDELSPEEALIELQELQNALPAPTATDTTTAIDITTSAYTAAAAMVTSIGTAVPGCSGFKRLSSAQHLAGHVVVLGFPPRPSHMECFLRPLVQHRRHRPALVFVSAALAPLEAAFGRLVRTTGDELDLSDVYVLEVHSR